MKLPILPVLGLTSAFVGCSALESKNPTLCELAAKRSAYAGRTLTVEGMLFITRHGSMVVDPGCDQGVPIEWYEDDGLHELSEIAERAQAKPRTIRVRVTGEMQRASRSQFLNEPYWYLRLRSAQVLGAERSQ